MKKGKYNTEKVARVMMNKEATGRDRKKEEK